MNKKENNTCDKFLKKSIHIRNKDEFDKLLDRYIKLNNLTKVDRILSYEEIEELRSALISGITIEKESTINEIILSIVNFLNLHGFDGSYFYTMLENTDFSITSLKVLFDSIGLAMSSGKKIMIDISIAEFNKSGNFLGIKTNDFALLRHILIHEFLHRISAFRDDKKDLMANDTALSEGFTDLFAETISEYNGPKKSKTYQFSKDVCNIFVSLIGFNTALDNYLNHLMEYPNLRNLFNSYNLNFDEFVKEFDRLLMRRYKKEEENSIIEEENNLLIILKDNLIIPFIKDHPELENEIIEKFNIIFEDRNISVSLEKRI